AFAVSLSELLLGRTIKSVLDVGCGEAPWQRELMLLRPRVKYQGVDSSDYIVDEFGKSLGVRKGSFGGLAQIGLHETFDLLVCCDVLHYVPDDEVKRGLIAFEELLFGVA